MSPFGDHQAGIATPAPARVTVTAFTLKPGVDKAALGRLMRLWSEDVKALTQGTPATGDPAWELVGQPSSLTVTVGFGPKVFTLDGLRDKAPAGLVPVPVMKHDKLQERWSGGDLVVQVCADDSLAISHVTRRMAVDAAPFATVRWQQSGFWRANGVGTPGETGRNLMGQVDGTGEPGPERLPVPRCRLVQRFAHLAGGRVDDGGPPDPDAVGHLGTCSPATSRRR